MALSPQQQQLQQPPEPQPTMEISNDAVAPHTAVVNGDRSGRKERSQRRRKSSMDSSMKKHKSSTDATSKKHSTDSSSSSKKHSSSSSSNMTDSPKKRSIRSRRTTTSTVDGHRSMDSSNNGKSLRKTRSRPLDTSGHSTQTAETSQTLDMDASYASTGSMMRQRRSSDTQNRRSSGGKKMSASHREFSTRKTMSSSSHRESSTRRSKQEPYYAPTRVKRLDDTDTSNRVTASRVKSGTTALVTEASSSNGVSKRRGRTTHKRSTTDTKDSDDKPRSKSLSAKKVSSRSKSQSATTTQKSNTKDKPKRSKSQAAAPKKSTTRSKSQSAKPTKKTSSSSGVKKTSVKKKQSTDSTTKDTLTKPIKKRHSTDDIITTKGRKKTATPPRRTRSMSPQSRILADIASSSGHNKKERRSKEETNDQDNEDASASSSQKDASESEEVPSDKEDVSEPEDSSFCTVSSSSDLSALGAIQEETNKKPKSNKSVAFGKTHIKVYEDTQEPTTKFYSKEDLQMLLSHEISISTRLADSKHRKNVNFGQHCCWRGFEHIKLKYNKAERNQTHVRMVLHAQHQLAQQSIQSSIPEKLRVVSRSDSKEDRKRAYYYGMDDAEEVMHAITTLRMEEAQRQIDFANKVTNNKKGRNSATAALKVAQHATKGTIVEKTAVGITNLTKGTIVEKTAVGITNLTGNAAMGTKNVAMATGSALANTAFSTRHVLATTTKNVIARSAITRSLRPSRTTTANIAEQDDNDDSDYDDSREDPYEEEMQQRSSTGSLFTMFHKKPTTAKRSPMVESLLD
ncbi:expressed unknown protein [Seminavis robusta]|uniref:Uncharacterized protein n=1 Tax=Seminavis robusta TaxID=568900 RepID=A0A9N8EPK4_9STRA|nr:expressed unknown protein [Seminavis robusta]|eukprot:Sro1456_g274290.1 n/a (796) ;mRNA; f:23285-25672